ncbi:MAG: VOC family protein [Candidatus Obscuribacterales bacterium]|nr:VOC family protein [Candidatus Obscuribacterales bacterium]
MSKVDAIPKGYHTITPGLVYKDTKAAIEFYKKAFGAEEKEVCLGPNGKVMHAEMKLGTSIFMMNDEFPEMGCVSPETLKGTPVSMYVYVENVDQFVEKAVKAGAKETMPVGDMFWGDRMGQIMDPFGHKWAISTHTKDMTPEEIQKGQEEWMKKQMACAK